MMNDWLDAKNDRSAWTSSVMTSTQFNVDTPELSLGKCVRLAKVAFRRTCRFHVNVTTKRRKTDMGEILYAPKRK
jgi:hypothetical protein